MKIVDYTPKYREAFKQLNQWWIEKYFTMEAADYKALDFPEKNIIEKGGHIIFAVHESEAVGTCALMKLEDLDYDYELAKMGVHPDYHGQGIGYLLGKAVIEKARLLGAKTVYLESNPPSTYTANSASKKYKHAKAHTNAATYKWFWQCWNDVMLKCDNKWVNFEWLNEWMLLMRQCDNDTMRQ